MKQIFEEIAEERRRQTELHGEQNHSPIIWQSILMEEVGEAAQVANQYHFGEDVKNPFREAKPATDTTQQIRLIAYRKELIQVAAVAIQMIECLDRNEGKDL